MVLSGFLLGVGAGATILAAEAGAGALTRVATGFGHADVGIARALPSWKLVIIEIIAAALLGLGLLGSLLLTGFQVRRIRLILTVLLTAFVAPTAVYIVMDHGATLDIHTMQSLRDAVYRHLLPAMLPALTLLAAVVATGRKGQSSSLRQIIMLVGAICVAARVRRGFEHVEWFHFLLEIPLYATLIHFLLGEQSHRAIILILVMLALIGIHMYWKWGVGPLTLAGEYKATVTTRGTVHWHLHRIREYEAIRDILDRRDPSGKRPIFRFGAHNGGLNYLLGRPSPTSITQGFLYSVIEPETALAELLSANPPLFLIYDHIYDSALEPQLRVAWSRWDRPLQPERHVSYDMPYFDRLRAGCVELEVVTGTPARFTVYDCAGHSSVGTSGTVSMGSRP